MERGLLHTSDTEMSLYGMENWRLPSVCIRRYSLRTDGFASLRGPYGGGTVTTVPFVFDGGELELNYSTSAVGSVRAELLAADGDTPVAGFSLADSQELFGDRVDGTIGWSGDPSLQALAGTPVRLRLQLHDADLFAFRFR